MWLGTTVTNGGEKVAQAFTSQRKKHRARGRSHNGAEIHVLGFSTGGGSLNGWFPLGSPSNLTGHARSVLRTRNFQVRPSEVMFSANGARKSQPFSWNEPHLVAGRKILQIPRQRCFFNFSFFPGELQASDSKAPGGSLCTGTTVHVAKNLSSLHPSKCYTIPASATPGQKTKAQDSLSSTGKKTQDRPRGDHN